MQSWTMIFWLLQFYLEIEISKEELVLSLKPITLASPPLVVAYAIAGNMNFDMYKDSLGKSKDGKDVYLKDIWPTNKEIEDTFLFL